MKEIFWLSDDLSKTNLLGISYVGTYIGPDYSILEIEDKNYDYLVSLGRCHTLYMAPDLTVISPHGTIYIGNCKLEGWNFLADDESFTKDTPIFSPFDEIEEFEEVYASNLDEYLEEYLGVLKDNIYEKAGYIYALAKLNKLSVSELLWKIERSKWL